jgi:hypothetical protein
MNSTLSNASITNDSRTQQRICIDKKYARENNPFRSEDEDIEDSDSESNDDNNNAESIQV